MDFSKLFDDCSEYTSRAALYYAARYMKQAEHFDLYKKDIFSDLGEGSFAEDVRELVSKVVGYFEAREGMSAREIKDERFIKVMAEIAQMERSLGGALTDEQVAISKNFIASMTFPTKDGA